MNKPRIVLAEDHTMVAEGIGKLLEHDYDLISVVGDGRSLLNTIKRDPPDLAIVDLSLPLLTGVEATRQIKKLFPSMYVIILTMHTDPLLVKDAMAAGASGYLIKESASSELLLALKEVLHGRTYLSRTVALTFDKKAVRLSHDEAQTHPEMSLTPRQRDILQLIAEGQSNKGIATILHIHIKTVEFHKTRLMRTLGLHSIPELTKYAIANRIISVSC